MSLKNYLFYTLSLIFVFTTTGIHSQVKIYPDITSASAFWSAHQKATEYQSTNIQKADSLRFVLLNLAKKENDSVQFFANLFDAEIDKIQIGRAHV